MTIIYETRIWTIKHADIFWATHVTIMDYSHHGRQHNMLQHRRIVGGPYSVNPESILEQKCIVPTVDFIVNSISIN